MQKTQELKGGSSGKLRGKYENNDEDPETHDDKRKNSKRRGTDMMHRLLANQTITAKSASILKVIRRNCKGLKHSSPSTTGLVQGDAPGLWKWI